MAESMHMLFNGRLVTIEKLLRVSDFSNTNKKE